MIVAFEKLKVAMRKKQQPCLVYVCVHVCV